jgi:hypothetical protein
VKQSQQVLEWQAEARAEGRVEGRVEVLLEVLQARFGPVPGDLESSVRATTDLGLLKQWLAPAVTVSSLQDFRRAVGL